MQFLYYRSILYLKKYYFFFDTYLYVDIVKPIEVQVFMMHVQVEIF